MAWLDDSEVDMRTVHIAAIALTIVAAFPAAASADTTPGQYIVVLKDSAGDAGAVAADHGRKYDAKTGHVFRHALKGYSARVEPQRLAALRSDPSVAYVAEDEREFRMAATVDCQTLTQQTFRLQQCLPAGVDRIDAESSSTRSGDGRGAVDVNIAIVDSGVDPRQPELNVRGGVDCVDHSKTPQEFDDQFGHGTFVAGNAAARDNGFGVVGTAPGANIWAVRVVPKNQNIGDSELLCGVDWVTATRTDADPRNDIAVANMSISGGGTDDGNCGLSNKDPLHTALCRSTAAGVVWTVVAGNSNHDLALEKPSAYDEVLTVTAMSDFDGRPGGLDDSQCFGQDLFQLYGERDDMYATFSNFATTPADAAHTIAGPGVCVSSTLPVSFCSDVPAPPPGVPDQCYGHGDGTSFSSPYVAGTVALCIAARRCTGTPAQIIRKVISDARAYNTATKNRAYGFAGDPLRPITGENYGYLINAGLY